MATPRSGCTAPVALTSFEDVLYWLGYGPVCIYTTKVLTDLSVPAMAQVTRYVSSVTGNAYFIARRNVYDRVGIAAKSQAELEMEYNNWVHNGLIVSPVFSVPE